MAVFPRVQKVVLPILRADPRLAGVTINSWIPDIDYREFPLIGIRRIGGRRNEDAPTVQSGPVIEMTAFTTTNLIDCENLYETALDVLYDAVQNQTVTPDGSIQSMFETMGSTQFSSMFQDSWRVQGLIRLSVRRPRN
jgi:hypothetical protein